MTFELWDWLNETDDDVRSSGFPSLGMDLRMMMTLTHPPVGRLGEAAREELSGKFNWQCSLPWDRIRPRIRRKIQEFVGKTKIVVRYILYRRNSTHLHITLGPVYRVTIG